jgi:hypothetical protein
MLLTGAGVLTALEFARRHVAHRALREATRPKSDERHHSLFTLASRAPDQVVGVPAVVAGSVVVAGTVVGAPWWAVPGLPGPPRADLPAADRSELRSADLAVLERYGDPRALLAAG